MAPRDDDEYYNVLACMCACACGLVHACVFICLFVCLFVCFDCAPTAASYQVHQNTRNAAV